MTRRTEAEADRIKFLKLLTGRDIHGDIPVALRLDVPSEWAAVMAPGITDFDELQIACQRYIKNWLANRVDELERHLDSKARQ